MNAPHEGHGGLPGSTSEPARLLERLRRFTRIVFDLDGTLYDTRDFERPALAAVADWVRARSGQPLKGFEQALWMRREADRHRPGLFDEVLAAHGLPSHWGQECAQHFHVYPGGELGSAATLEPTLHTLRASGARLALVSNGRQCLQARKLENLNLHKLFDICVYCDPRVPQQVKPAGWAWLQLEKWRDKLPTAHVGDDVADDGFARAGEARFIPFRFRSPTYED